MTVIEKLIKLDEISIPLNCAKHEDGFEFCFIINVETIELINECKALGISFDSFSFDGIYQEFDSLQSNVGKECTALLLSEQLRNDGLNIYWSWQEFLSYKPNLFSVPENFLIINENVISPCENISGRLKHYLDVNSLIKLISEYADHSINLTDKIIEELVFLHKTRLEIPIIFTSESLGEGLDGISVFSGLFEDKSHKDQKTSILKEVLYSLLSNIPKLERLEYLFIHFGEFSKRFTENYNLFVSEFSFDEVRKEYEESKRDYFIKLNDIFSSVQTKMLGIPISLALASFKMSSIVDDVSFWTNLLLVISIVIYTSMMVMLIKNQKHSLESIKSEYTSQMARLKHQYAKQYEQIKNIQTDLDTRYKFQKSCLNWFYAMSSTLFVLILALFFWNLPWKLILGLS